MKKKLEKRRQQLEKAKAEGFVIAIKDKKICSDCKEEKDSIEFTLSKSKRDMKVRLNAKCKPCDSKRSLERYHNGGRFSDEQKLEIIERDKCCQYCGTTENLVADHIVAQHICIKDVASKVSNGQALCVPCNTAKRDRILIESIRDSVGAKEFKRMLKPEYLMLLVEGKYKRRTATIGKRTFNEIVFTEKPVEQP